MVVADFVQDQRVQQWLNGVEPAWTLLTRYWSIRPRSPKGSPWIVRHRRMVPGYFGGPVDAVRAWIRAAGISDGPPIPSRYVHWKGLRSPAVNQGDRKPDRDWQAGPDPIREPFKTLAWRKMRAPVKKALSF